MKTWSFYFLKKKFWLSLELQEKLSFSQVVFTYEIVSTVFWKPRILLFFHLKIPMFFTLLIIAVSIKNILWLPYSLLFTQLNLIYLILIRAVANECFAIPGSKTAVLLHKFYLSTVQLWNTTPGPTQHSSFLETFKKGIQSFTFKNKLLILAAFDKKINLF